MRRHRCRTARDDYSITVVLHKKKSRVCAIIRKFAYLKLFFKLDKVLALGPAELAKSMFCHDKVQIDGPLMFWRYDLLQ